MFFLSAACFRLPCVNSSTLPIFDVVNSLFRRFAVEMLVVGLCILPGMMDDTVSVIRRSIERIELHGDAAGIDDVVLGPSRDDYREPRTDRGSHAIENRFTGPILHAKELVKRVNFHPDLFLGP